MPTLDFSGWPVFCLESAPEEMIYKFCEALEARKDRIPWYGKGPMALETMCKGRQIADVVAVIGSIDVVLGAIDR